MKPVKTISIDNTEWMLEDLSLIETKEGKILKLADTKEEWNIAFQNRDPAYKKSMHPGGGILYNLFALNIIIPTGWKLPNEDDWYKLSKALTNTQEDIDSFGFKDRANFALCNNEDRNDGAYWLGGFTPDESWGTKIENLSLIFYAGVTKWGCDCDYGLFIRCIKEKTM